MLLPRDGMLLGMHAEPGVGITNEEV